MPASLSVRVKCCGAVPVEGEAWHGHAHWVGQQMMACPHLQGRPLKVLRVVPVCVSCVLRVLRSLQGRAIGLGMVQGRVGHASQLLVVHIAPPSSHLLLVLVALFGPCFSCLGCCRCRQSQLGVLTHSTVLVP